VVLDDVENETEVRSADHRAKVLEWFNKAVAKLGTGTTNIVAVGTILHFDALLGRLTDSSKSPGWTGRKYKAVISFADRADLWETWEAVYTHREEYRGASGPGAAETFYKDHEGDLLAGSRVLWERHESYKALMEMRVREGRVAFDCEKQNEPTDPETCLFRDSDFCYWDDQYASEQELLAALGSGVQIFGGCDPSLGKKGRQHDDTAIITLAKDASGVHYVLDADIRKRKPDEILDTVASYHTRRGYQRFGFEVNQFQEFLGDELIKRSRAAGVEVPVYKIAHTTDKLLRIQTLQPLVSSGGIRFSRRHAVLLEQLRQFPHGAHDDGPDALEMAIEAGRHAVVIGVWAGPGARARDDDDWGWEPINSVDDFYRYADRNRWC
jgi:predicted phage terminase large subunit-like protein